MTSFTLSRGVSDAKKRALYDSRVFANGSEPAAAPASELSQLKLREMTGHDIFNRDAAPEASFPVPPSFPVPQSCIASWSQPPKPALINQQITEVGVHLVKSLGS